ncbi:hypothetical protein N566_14160, partial [Streptomycetaceae bacterium MP113-05]
MSDQGETDEPRTVGVPGAGARAGERDGWWSRLYDSEARDAGGVPADDTIDDRFAAARAVGASIPGRPDVGGAMQAPGLVEGAPGPSGAPDAAAASTDRPVSPVERPGPVDPGGLTRPLVEPDGDDGPAGAGPDGRIGPAGGPRSGARGMRGALGQAVRPGGGVGAAPRRLLA